MAVTVSDNLLFAKISKVDTLVNCTRLLLIEYIHDNIHVHTCSGHHYCDYIFPLFHDISVIPSEYTITLNTFCLVIFVS